MRRSYVRYSSIRNIPLSGLLRFQPHFWVPASPLNQVPAFSGSGYPKCTILRTKNYSSLYPELETPILCTLGTRFFRKWVPKMYHFTHKKPFQPVPGNRNSYPSHPGYPLFPEVGTQNVPFYAQKTVPEHKRIIFAANRGETRKCRIYPYNNKTEYYLHHHGEEETADPFSLMDV